MPQPRSQPGVCRLARDLATAAVVSGRSVRDLAVATHVSHSTVDRWLHLRCEPVLGPAARFAEVLGLRLELLDVTAGTQSPCGHRLPLPQPSGTKVECRDCHKHFRWVPVEVEG